MDSKALIKYSRYQKIKRTEVELCDLFFLAWFTSQLLSVSRFEQTENQPFFIMSCEFLFNDSVKSGIPVPLGTSFNVTGEPNSESPIEAIHRFFSTQAWII